MKNLAISIFMLFLSTGILFAQDTLKLNFNDAVKMALDKNIQLQEEKNNLQSSQASNMQSIGQFLPSVYAGTYYNYRNGLSFNQYTGDVVNTTSKDGSVGVQANYTIFSGLGRIYSVRNTELQLKSQQDYVTFTQQTVIYNVAQQFLQVLLDRELQRIDNENLKAQKVTLEQIAGYVTAGSKPLSDRLTQEAQVKKLEVTKIRDENKIRLDISMLNQTLMLEPGKQVDLVEPGWELNTILTRNYDLNDLYQTALANRPDYKKALADIDASQAFIGYQKSAFYPKLSVSYTYGSAYTSDLGFNLDTQLKNNRSSTLGFSLSIPIFNQFYTAGQVSKARVINDNNQLIANNLKLKIFQDVQTSYLNFIAAKNEYNATQSQYEAAVEAQKIQQESYDLGVSDLVQLSQANQTYVDAAASRAQAQYTLLFQQVMLNYSPGTLNPDDLH